MNKLVVTLAAALAVSAAMARPGFGPRPWHPGPVPMHYHHHHHGGAIAAGIVGGAIVGGLLYDAVRPAPVVVTPAPVIAAPTVIQSAPVVVSAPVTTVVTPAPAVVSTVTQNVWVEGRYVDQPQANGTVLRTWQPGHYEQRTVQVAQ